MIDYLPSAKFDINSEPTDEYSPHTLEEENEMKQAILEGYLKPRNQYEIIHQSQICHPRPKAEWPQKWVTCKKCRCDWRCTGYPAGRQTKFSDQIRSHQLVDRDGFLWLWPNICQPCADFREAKPAPKAKIEKKVKQPYKDA